MSIRRHRRMRQFQCRDYLFPGNSGEGIQELFDAVVPLKIVDEIPKRHTSADKYWSTPQYFGIAVNYGGRCRHRTLLDVNPALHKARDNEVVPEIRSEIPSEGEHREYFETCLQATDLGAFGLPDDQFLKLHPGEHGLGLLKCRELGAQHFASLCQEWLWRGLRRMNELPRSDPFWENTNKRPTWFKLRDFCDRLLTSDPNDEMALWCRGFLTCNGGNEFGQSSWARLYSLGSFDLAWAVCAAYWMSPYSESENVEDFARMLRSHLSIDGIHALLRPFATAGSDALTKWISEVEAACVRELAAGR